MLEDRFVTRHSRKVSRLPLTYAPIARAVHEYCNRRARNRCKANLIRATNRRLLLFILVQATMVAAKTTTKIPTKCPKLVVTKKVINSGICIRYRKSLVKLSKPVGATPPAKPMEALKTDNNLTTLSAAVPLTALLLTGKKRRKFQDYLTVRSDPCKVFVPTASILYCGNRPRPSLRSPCC